MWDNSKISLRQILPLLAGMTIAVSGAHADQDEEKLLALPTAEIEAAAKDYSHFFRVISQPSFPNRDLSFAIAIYFTDSASAWPMRGFIFFKIRAPDGAFWERSRALTANEVVTVCNLIDGEEIFSLPAKQERDGLMMHSYRDGTTYFFTHIDKVRHIREEITRSPQISNPAQRLMAGLGEIIKEYSVEFDKGHTPEKGYLPEKGKPDEK